MRIAGTASASVSVSERSRSSTVRASAGGPSTGSPAIRKATAVTLSSPPASLAARTSRRTASSSGPPPPIRRPIASSPIRPDRPSEQSSRTSPSRTWTTLVSTSSSGPAPSARVITERCGCTAASSRVSRPERSSSRDQRVVVGELLQHAVAQQVCARVADVAEHHAIAVEQRGRDGRPHARRRRVVLRSLEHATVRLEDRAAETRLGILAGGGRELAEGVDREARGELSGACASHPVGDDEQRRIVEVGVLVRAPDLAGVARACVVGDAHGAYSSYLSSVSPTRTSSPARRRCSATSACPATCVPFVEPRSST